MLFAVQSENSSCTQQSMKHGSSVWTVTTVIRHKDEVVNTRIINSLPLIRPPIPPRASRGQHNCNNSSPALKLVRTDNEEPLNLELSESSDIPLPILEVTAKGRCNNDQPDMPVRHRPNTVGQTNGDNYISVRSKYNYDGLYLHCPCVCNLSWSGDLG